MTAWARGKIDLEGVLDEALRALTVLDADALEELAEFLERGSENLVLPGFAVARARLRSRLWVLGHLLYGTGRRLEMLRRVSSLPGRGEGYGGRSARGPSQSLRLALPVRLPSPTGESFADQVAGARAAN